MTSLILGQTLAFTSDPFATDPTEAVVHHRHGAVAMEDGRIVVTGPADRLRADYPDAKVTDHGQNLILPGFVDAHVHYPQTAIIASWGKRLIDWLNTYTFPEEARFNDPAYAGEIANRYLDLALAHGTTSACSFATIHPASVDQFSSPAKRD